MDERDPQGDQPPSSGDGSEDRGWWAARPPWQKAAAIGGAALAVVVVVTLLFVGDDEGDEVGAATTAPATTAPGATATTGTVTIVAETTTTAAPPTTTAATTTTPTTDPAATSAPTTAASGTTTSAATATTLPAATTTTAAPGTTVPEQSIVTFGDGTWSVGTDIPPGTYRNDDSSALCLWSRLSISEGGVEDEIAGDLTEFLAVVTIEPSDAAFEAIDCGTWSNDLAPITASPDAPFGDGTWIVGSDIAAGTWQNDDSSLLCLWERVAAFSGEEQDVLATDLTDEIATVEIAATDVGFIALDCGTWTKVG